MRAIVQRVKYVNMNIENKLYSSIDKGLLVYLGVHKNDTMADLDYLAKKIVNMRIFEDENQKMNLSIKDINGEIMIVSQFTLYGDMRKGNRPGFTESAKGDFAEHYYNEFVKKLKSEINIVETGIFGADMQVEYINDGPVTIQLDSSKMY